MIYLNDHVWWIIGARVEKFRVEQSDSMPNLHPVLPPRIMQTEVIALWVQYLTIAVLIYSITNCCAYSLNYKFMWN